MGCNDCKPLPHLSEKDILRFWSHVDKRGPDECWPWMAGRLRPGYGRFYAPAAKKGTYLISSRVAFFLCSGINPFPFLVCHTCDNPSCCNGAHLFVGTHADNAADMVAKGRSARGDKNPKLKAKITTEQALKIRTLYSSGGINQAEVGFRFNLSQSEVSRIVNKHRWFHGSD